MSYIKQKDENSGGTIGGSIANEQVAFGSGADTIEGVNELKYIKTDPSLKFMGDDGSFLVGAGGSDFDSDFYFQVYGAESRVDSSLPIRIKGGNSEAKFITECNEARTGGQNVGEVQFKGLDSASSVVKYGQIQVDVESDTAATKTSSMLFKVAKSDGSFPEIVRFTGGGVVIGNPDDGNEYTLPMTDGSANQVLQTDGSGNVTFQNAGGGGMLPRAQKVVSSSSEYFEEILGCTSGINIEGASVMTTTSWNNGTARFRPHCFSASGTLGNVTMQLTTVGLTGVQTRDVYVGIWSMSASGVPTTKKCTATIQLNASSSTGQISLPWTAEAGQDLLVEAGEWYWVAFSTTGSGSPGFRFWQSLRLPSSTIQVTTGTGFNVFQTSFETGVDVPTAGSNPVFDNGDSSGVTWAFMGLNIS